MRIGGWIVGALALLWGVVPAAAQTTTIDFESDTRGTRPNGFFSTQSPVVSFSDSMGADLLIENFSESNLTQGLAVGGGDGSALVLNFSTIVNALSLAFGNDDIFKGDTATLKVYRDDVQVGIVNLLVNSNDIADETIGISGVSFNKAVFAYTQDGENSINGEIVDNIVFTEGDAAVPEPSAAWLFLPVLTAFTLFRKRRS